MAARRTNFTSKSDIASEGELFATKYLLYLRSTTCPHTARRPRRRRADAFGAFNKFTRVSREIVSCTNNGDIRIVEFNQPGHMGQWSQHPLVVSGVEEQFPRLHTHQRKHASIFQQSNKATSTPAPFSLPLRRTPAPTPTTVASAIVKLDAATQTSTPTTLTAAAQSLIQANPAAIIASSMMHQAATAIQRRFERPVTRTEFFRKKAESLIEHQENIQFARYLSCVLALQSFHFVARKLDGSEWERRNGAAVFCILFSPFVFNEELRCCLYF